MVQTTHPATPISLADGGPTTSVLIHVVPVSVDQRGDNHAGGGPSALREGP